nr:uncharacterized protein LOC127316097 [Lolium perenne]
MPHRLKTTYSMLGLNGRALPPPPPQPEPEPQHDTEYSSDDDEDPRFAVWHEAYVADAEAEEAEEAAQWGEQPQALADPEQTAILVSLNVQRFQRLKEEEREFFNNANLEHALMEARRLLMEAQQQKLCELNAHRHYEAFAREQARHVEIEASRQRLEARGQHRRQAPATPTAMLHRQMREARDEKRARTQAAKAKNDDEAGPSRTPTDGH